MAIDCCCSGTAGRCCATLNRLCIHESLCVHCTPNSSAVPKGDDAAQQTSTMPTGAAAPTVIRVLQPNESSNADVTKDGHHHREAFPEEGREAGAGAATEDMECEATCARHACEARQAGRQRQRETQHGDACVGKRTAGARCSQMLGRCR